MRIRRFAGVVVLAGGLGLVAGAPGAHAAGPDPVAPLVTNLAPVTDAVGDAVDTATAAVVGNDRADITGASVEFAPGWIRMKVQLKNAADPLKDQAWSDKSDAEWALDTNNDGKEDFTVEFATHAGELYGAVFDATKPDDKSKCDADSASYSPQDGYTLVIDPACIGNPKALGYAVAVFFDTNPKDDKNPMVTDRVPDQGFTLVAAPGQPLPAPPPAPPGPPAGAVGPAAAGAAARPGSAPGVPRVAAGTPSAGPRRAASSSGVAPAQSPAPAGAPAATTAPAASGLARTGTASARQSLFGLGIMLLGAGVVVMTRPTRRAVQLLNR